MSRPAPVEVPLRIKVVEAVMVRPLLMLKLVEVAIVNVPPTIKSLEVAVIVPVEEAVKLFTVFPPPISVAEELVIVIVVTPALRPDPERSRSPATARLSASVLEFPEIVRF